MGRLLGRWLRRVSVIVTACLFCQAASESYRCCCDACSYAANTTWCEVYYDELGNTTSGEEIVVTEACCVCRDSDSGPTDSGPTASSPNHPPVASPTHSPGLVSGTAQAWVDAHNKRRSEHGKPPVSWSAELAAQAKAWTDYLVRAQSCDLVHISDTCGVGAGENLAANWSSDGGSPESPEEVCKGWTEDELVLVPTHGHEQAGHATQVLWKHSIHIGCATSSGDCGHVSACRYHPSGNFNCVHGNCVETIFDNAEELDDEPMPSTSAVEDCNQQNQPGYA